MTSELGPPSDPAPLPEPVNRPAEEQGTPEHIPPTARLPDLAEAAPASPLPLAPILAPPAARGAKAWPAWGWLPVVLALAAGLALGALIQRHRQEASDTLVAVNGVRIFKSQLVSRLESVAGLATMHAMVEEELQLQFAKKKGLLPTDAQVEARYAAISKQPDFTGKLEASHQSGSEFKHRLLVQMAQAAVLGQGIKVSEAEVRDFYKQQTDPHNPAALFYKPEQISLRAIATPDQTQAQSALKELNGDTPFAIVASEYSADASKANGGVLDPLTRGRSPLSRDPALEAAVFRLKPGERVGPAQYGKAWWIFQCDDRSPATILPFEQVRDDCRQGALLVKGRRLNAKRVEVEFQEFETSSKLQAFQPQYRPALSHP